MERAEELCPEAFDEKGFLKLVEVKKIAKELSRECSKDRYLKKMYDKVGLPLVAVRKNWKQFEVYAKLRIK